MVNLFIHVLQLRDISCVNRDVSLLDFAAGHFARVEFSTGCGFLCSFTKTLASHARKFVDNAFSNDGIGTIVLNNESTLADGTGERNTDDEYVQRANEDDFVDNNMV